MQKAWIAFLYWLIPVRNFAEMMVLNDGFLGWVNLLGIGTLIGLLALLACRRKLGLIYWVVASIPAMGGTLLGVWQYDATFARIRQGGSFVGLSPEELLMLPLFTIHAALFLSACAYLLVALFHLAGLITKAIPISPSEPVRS